MSDSKERADFEAWWEEFEAEHPEWRFADSAALRWAAWQARAQRQAASGVADASPAEWRPAVAKCFAHMRNYGPLDSIPSHWLDAMRDAALASAPTRPAPADVMADAAEAKT